MSIAQTLVTALDRFNAKERNHLMRFALLGEKSTMPSRPWVDKVFFNDLKAALVDVPVEAAISLSDEAICVYAAMDYHLDWLYAALWCSKVNVAADSNADFIPVPRRLVSTESQSELARQQYDVMGNLEDIDFLVVIKDGSKTYLVMIEAKGESSFSRSQLASKMARLRLILDDTHIPPDDQLHFVLVLMAPSKAQLKFGGARTYGDLATYPAPANKNQDLTSLTIPMRRLSNVIFRMLMPSFPGKLDRVTRCDSDGKNPKGRLHSHWKIVSR